SEVGIGKHEVRLLINACSVLRLGRALGGGSGFCAFFNKSGTAVRASQAAAGLSGWRRLRGRAPWRSLSKLCANFYFHYWRYRVDHTVDLNSTTNSSGALHLLSDNLL